MNALKLLASVVACQLAGALGTIFTSSAIPAWYAGLKKPAFTPPNWLFAPMWISLYLLMALAAWLVWQKGLAHPGVRQALAVFIAQLLLNALWSPVFFGLRAPLAGAAVIVLLWLAIALTILLFWRISRPAALLLIPYLLWVSLATALNISIYLLNR
ncbi:MAG: tryptophan-rich sensory protein [Acidobacteria bacterium]|jgi:tryptophan-rich sensory protein|nr:tryptophan-rich sensory protein [Acidobacteriota bacterium]